MMTRLLIIALVLILSVPLAEAQNVEKRKISFAVLGGVNFQNLTGLDHSGDKLTNSLLTGYHAGVNVQIPIAPSFCFQPGLLYSLKGAKNISGSLTSTTKVSYIEMPLNLVYKALLGKGYFMLGFGPYVGYGFAGKVLTEGGSLSLDQKIKFTSVVETGDDLTVPYYKAFDFGGNIFAGYELANGIFAQFNTQLGMVKINPEYKIAPDDKSVVKNTGFGLSLGYRF